jgi:hypothetical protein
MYRTITRLLLPLAFAVAGVAMMGALGHAPQGCASAQARTCASTINPQGFPTALPGDGLTVSRARPLRVSLPDFLNLGAPRHSHAELK